MISIKALTVYHCLQRLEFKKPLDQLLSRVRFYEVGRLQQMSSGFVPPLDGFGEPGPVQSDDMPMTVTTHDGVEWFRHRIESKILPPEVVKRHTSERIQKLESERGMKLGRAERLRIQDDVTFELLPKAFTRIRDTWGLYDPVTLLVVIGSSSAEVCDQVADSLHTAVGSLPLAFAQVHQRPATAMTDWIMSTTEPEGLALEDVATMKQPGDLGAVVRVRNQNLWSPEVLGHVNAGKEVESMRMTVDDQASLTLSDKLTIKGLRWHDWYGEQLEQDESAEDIPGRMLAEATLQAGSIREVLTTIYNAFGGLDYEAMGVEEVASNG